MLSAVVWSSAESQPPPEPAGVGAEAPVTLARWEERKKSIVRVGCILDDAFCSAQAACMVHVLNGEQLSASDLLGSFHHPLGCFTV